MYIAEGMTSNELVLKLEAMCLKMYPRSEPASPFLSFLRRFSSSSSTLDASLITPKEPLNVDDSSLGRSIMHSHFTTASRRALLLPPTLSVAELFPVKPVFVLTPTMVHPSVCHPRVSIFHHAHHTHHTFGLSVAANRALLARWSTLFPHSSSV